MRENPTSMKVPPVFKVLIKRAIVNHAYTKKLTEGISQKDMLLRFDRYMKLYPNSYLEFINMEDKDA
jgi:hypothetical protein